MNFFEDFKPIRNKLRQLHFYTALDRIYLYKGRRELLPEIAEFLYINIIIYSDKQSVDHKFDKIFSDVIYGCDKLSGKVYSAQIDSMVWRWLHTLAHTQLKSNSNNYINVSYRYFLIFSDPKITTHIEKFIGISYIDFLRCALWLHAVFSRRYKVPKSYFMRENTQFTSFSKINMTKTLKLLSLPIIKLREELKKTVTYDEDIFIFQGNCHLEYPIIDEGKNLYCLFPEHLLSQALSGIYYMTKIYESEFDLANAFGKSFERYVGIILSKNNEQGKYDISEEIVFEYKHNTLKTSDWIVFSDTEIIFIECKTKRLRLPSKTLEKFSETLDEDIAFIAHAIIQLYKIADHYKSGNISELVFDPMKKIRLIVITMEEWFIGAPDIRDKLNLKIEDLLKENGIYLEISMQFPYECYSIDRFEVDSQIMFKMGFNNFSEMQKRGEIDEKFMSTFKFKSYHDAEFNDTFLEF